MTNQSTPERIEKWRQHVEYYWGNWVIEKTKGWYEISINDPRPYLIPIKFRRINEAQKYCETLNTLVDWEKIRGIVKRLGYIESYDEIVAYFESGEILRQAALETSLDISRSSTAIDLSEFASGPDGRPL